MLRADDKLLYYFNMNLSNKQIEDNLKTLRQRLDQLTAEAGREPSDVKLIAVSKTCSADAVNAAYEAGQRLFGENKVQELCQKTGKTPADCEWHFLGHLQRNKVSDALEHASWIHSLDSLKLADRINRVADENNVNKPFILIEVNVLGEESKYGVDFEGARQILEETLKSYNLNIQGLMTMAPYQADPSVTHRVFASLRELRDTLQTEFGVMLPELSMGMSDDYDIAVQEGSTMVRLGRAIFGERPLS